MRSTPNDSALEAGLAYVSDTSRGISRRRTGKAFSFRDADGGLVRDPETLRRIRALVIPPAWTNVWISPDPDGHIQAVGRDARGRKQYRYHPRWRSTRDDAKFHRMLSFGRALPILRQQVERDMRRPGLPREKVLAAIIRLLERTQIRVGNEEYARANASYGLTTLRREHAEVGASRLRFTFRGKSGKMHEVTLRDERLARVVRRCQELPGQELFQYLDGRGTRRAVTSDDVNAYLREASGRDFTAKDFRTWAATVRAAWELRAQPACTSQRDGKRTVNRAVESVSRRLGNTPAICRKSYIHPAVLSSYLDGSLHPALKRRRQVPAGLSAPEAAVLSFLKQVSRPGAAQDGPEPGPVVGEPGASGQYGTDTPACVPPS